MNRLLKCPFCGSNAMVILRTPIVETQVKEEWMVVCQNPEPECNARLPYCNSEEEAIRQWNRREEIERLEKEKEWLIKLLYKKICATPITLDAYRRSITDLMQQALKEK